MRITLAFLLVHSIELNTELVPTYDAWLVMEQTEPFANFLFKYLQWIRSTEIFCIGAVSHYVQFETDPNPWKYKPK